MSALRVLRLLPLFFFAACSTNQPILHKASTALRGLVRGGQQPISGSTIQLYAVGTTGDGSSATPLLNPAPKSDSSGNFNITGIYTCPSATTLVYIVATGGNPGLASGTNNSAISLMAALGPCGNLSAATYININELTTAASVNALAPFAASPSAIGSSAADAASLTSAFSLANEFANWSTGSSPGLGVPAGTSIPIARINTLANILATCINSPGGTAGDLTSCGNLFSLTTPSGMSPATDTVTAALHLAVSPALNTSALFNLFAATAPFQPSLTVAPSDFSLGLMVSSGLQPSPSAVSFGSANVGSTSNVQSITLSNTSQSPIALSGISISGINAAEFTQTNNCPVSLAVEALCTVQATFAPSTAAAHIALLSVANNSANSPLLIGLSGIGTVPIVGAPQLLSTSPASVTAGSPSITVTLSGTGFTSSSTIYVYSSAQPTTFLSAQSVSFTMGAQYLTLVGSLPLTVRNSGYISNALILPVVNPVPMLTSISPTTVTAGSPNFSLTVAGSGMSTASTVLINGISHAVSSTNGLTATVSVNATEVATVGPLNVTIVNPSPGGGTSESRQLQVIGAGNRLRTLNYPTLDIVSDNVHQLIYASVSSTSATSPNCVLAIDPLQGTVVGTQTMPSQPGQLAVTDDGSYLYVSLPAAGQISRLALPSLTPDINWSLGSDGSGHAYSAEDIESAPGQPHTVAVTRWLSGFGTGATGGLTIYDDGVARNLIPTGTYPSSSYNSIAWGKDATTLFGVMSAYSGGPEYIFTVTQNGPVLSTTLPEAMIGMASRLTFDSVTGRLYDGSGNAVDALTGASVGKFAGVQGPFATDSALGKAFFLVSNLSGSYGASEDVQAYDLNRFSFINSVTTTGLSGSKMVRWGGSGLAVGGGSQIFLIDGSFVSSSGISSPIGSYVTPSPTLTSVSPQTIAAGSGAVDITLNGTNFSQAAVVTWNGQTLPVNWLSDTQVTATIPASMLAQPLTAPVFISNGAGTENSPGVPFAVLPGLGPNMQITALNISGQDMVWDPVRSLLYVTGTNPSTVDGNSIAVVDPARSAIQNIVYTGNQPSALGISDDGQYLYAGFQTLAAVKRFTLPDFAFDLTIPLHSINGAYASFPSDVKVAPGHPQTIAVTMGAGGGGIAIFDNATQRPIALGFSITDDAYRLTWGKDATKLYTHSTPDSSSSDLSVLGIDDTGVASTIARYLDLLNLGWRPHYDPVTDLVYSDGGRVTNPVDGSPAGVLESRGLMVPDAKFNRAFFLRTDGATGLFYLDIFDLHRMTFLKSITIPGIAGGPTQLVRWGDQGLAFLTDTYGDGLGMLYLLQGSDISGVSTPPAGSVTLSPANIVEGSATSATITVNGADFLPTSTVLVNGSPRATTFLSSTQVSFQLSAAELAFAHYISIAVTNYATGGTTSPAATLEVDNPVPTITSLDKPNILIGSADTAITISGSGFVPTTIAQFNGTPRPTTYISPTQISCVLTSPDLLTAGIFPLTVVNPAPGGGSSVAPLEVDNPAPVIFGLYPSLVMTGSTGQNVEVQGTGFVPGTVIQIGGTPRLATYTSSNSINVQFTTADFASPGNISVVAVNPAPGGGASGAASIAVNNNVPGPITLNPSTVLQGTSTLTSITVSGSNFLPGSFVQVNNTNRPTTYVSPSQLTFLLTVADQATASSLRVTAVNPSPGGGSSTASLNVAAQAQTPIISSVYPSQFVTGTTNAYLQVIGTGFGASSVIEWDGTPLITSYDSYSGYFVAQVPASLLGTTGTVSITVNNATATPPLSNALTVTVVDPPAPSLTSISPAFGPINTAFTATLTGTDFVPNSTVAVNSVVVPTTFVNSTQLTASVPASAMVPGNINFTVTTPQPGGGTSGTIIYTAYVPIVNNSMVYNPADQLFYLSVPGNSGTPYANSVVSLDPVTGALGTPIFVGSEPNRLALASDGKSLWVGLDGASAVRKVDLVAHMAGQQFSLPTSSSYGSPMKALAMVAVPGQTDSVIISSAAVNQFGTTIGMLTLYDSGIPRGSSLSASPLSLQIDGSRNEVYGASGSLYQTYLYSSSGLASGTSVNTGSTLAAYEDDRIQLASGRVYTEYRKTFDAESGALVGTFSPNTPNTMYSPAISAIDPTAGLAFILNTSTQYASLPNSIQLFNLADFTPASAAAIPVNIATTNSYSPVASLSDMTRWGTNGLAFRNNVSVYPLRSNLVKDLSATPADLGVTLTSSGPNNTGTQTTYTATISNAGPASASEISLTALVPSTGVLVSASPSSGFCSSGANITCNLGALASGSSATVNLTVSQLTSGVSTMTVQVNASQTDANLANNQAASTSTITGQTYTVAPTLLSMTPTTVLAGSSDTTITVAGSGFGPGSAILLDGTPLPTNVVSATQLSAILPAASVAALGWHLVTVSNPSPGGGVSVALTLSIYSAIKAGANHIIYDPFSRKIFASVGSAMSSGNSIASLTPETGTFSTPAPIGSEPTRMALSDDGQMLYVLVSGASQIVRYNMLTQQPEATFPLNPSIASDNATAAAFAVQPGSEDTLAVTQGVGQPIEIVDFDPVTHTASARSSVVNAEAYSPHFLDSSTLFTTGSNFTSSLARYSILPSGLSSSVTYSLVSPPMGPFSLVNGIAFTSYGGVADVTTQSSRQLGQFPFSIPSTYNIDTTIGPQVSFDRAFFLAGYDGTSYTVTLPSGIAVFDTNTFSPAAFLPLNIPFIPEYNASAAADVIRWGQDGLAALTTDGTIYLLRGPAILHQLLQTNTPPVVSGSSGTLQHGSGNGILSLFGTNFLPGVAVTWNGTYRTTNWLDANHITVDIPATDLNLAGSASIAAANPGSASSSAFIVAIN